MFSGHGKYEEMLLTQKIITQAMHAKRLYDNIKFYLNFINIIIIILLLQ